MDGKRIKIYKFRSMREDGDRVLAEYLAGNASAQEEWAETQKLKEDPRITRVGKWVRKYSVDELPQLYNILKGDVSVAKHIILFHANWNPFNILMATVANFFWTYRFMNRVHKKCDSIGLNYYFHKKFGDTKTYVKTDMDWDIYPEGLEDALMMLTKYKKPLFISESGLADAADVYRTDYITRQVEATWRALGRGADVRAHMYWSLLDNYEWALGFEKRFGLVEIDFTTLKRTIRPSALVYKEICINNGVQ